MNHQEIIMQLIVNGGNARSKSIEAIQLAKTGQITAARETHFQACDALSQAHDTQSQLIQNEAAGVPTEITLLMVHAQDHLMNAITIKDLAQEMIDLYEKFYTAIHLQTSNSGL